MKTYHFNFDKEIEKWVLKVMKGKVNSFKYRGFVLYSENTCKIDLLFLQLYGKNLYKVHTSFENHLIGLN